MMSLPYLFVGAKLYNYRTLTIKCIYKNVSKFIDVNNNQSSSTLPDKKENQY
jgi:hypothetical protein